MSMKSDLRMRDKFLLCYRYTICVKSFDEIPLSYLYLTKRKQCIALNYKFEDHFGTTNIFHYKFKIVYIKMDGHLSNRIYLYILSCKCTAILFTMIFTTLLVIESKTYIAESISNDSEEYFSSKIRYSDTVLLKGTWITRLLLNFWDWKDILVVAEQNCPMGVIDVIFVKGFNWHKSKCV